jgi:hypothetical protein
MITMWHNGRQWILLTHSSMCKHICFLNQTWFAANPFAFFVILYMRYMLTVGLDCTIVVSVTSLFLLPAKMDLGASAEVPDEGPSKR